MPSVDEIAAMMETLLSLSFKEKLEINELLASSMRKEGGGTTLTKTPSLTLSEVKAKVAKQSAAGGGANPSAPAEWNQFLRAVWEEMKEANPDKMISFHEALKEASRRKAEMEGRIPKSKSAGGGTPSTEARELGQIQRDARLTHYSKLPTPSPDLLKLWSKQVKTPSQVRGPSNLSEAPTMPQIVIDGTKYWHDPASNGLWEVSGDNVESGTGSWVGYLQPGNEEEPIRHTEAFGSERKSRKLRKTRKSRK